jgi:hypothetical protein
VELGVFFGRLSAVRQLAAASDAALGKGFGLFVTGNYLVRKGAFLYHLANFLRGSIFYLVEA